MRGALIGKTLQVHKVAVHGFKGSRLRSCPRTPFWRRIYVRNARLRHCQSESWRRIGKYVAKPAFFTRTSGLLFLSLSLTLNVEPGTCERLLHKFSRDATFSTQRGSCRGLSKNMKNMSSFLIFILTSTILRLSLSF